MKAKATPKEMVAKSQEDSEKRRRERRVWRCLRHTCVASFHHVIASKRGRASAASCQALEVRCQGLRSSRPLSARSHTGYSPYIYLLHRCHLGD